MSTPSYASLPESDATTFEETFNQENSEIPLSSSEIEDFEMKFGRAPNEEERQALHFLEEQSQTAISTRYQNDIDVSTFLNCVKMTTSAIGSIKGALCRDNHTRRLYFVGGLGVGLAAGGSTSYFYLKFDEHPDDIKGRWKMYEAAAALQIAANVSYLQRTIRKGEPNERVQKGIAGGFGIGAEANVSVNYIWIF